MELTDEQRKPSYSGWAISPALPPRWKIKRLFSSFNSFRRLNVRYEYRVDNFLGFLHLACSLILLKSYL